ncbi:PREDICTED: uncharacterized protein KIAA0825-like, partial [Galeopterus variegatus]|uniref:Uncharacterized protein KIAA0825-like n=1 Tax=Galeopterus variegatus TaxID=482537 RepID=A0ABM0R044_GALVR
MARWKHKELMGRQENNDFQSVVSKTASVSPGTRILEKFNREVVTDKPRANETSIPSEQVLPTVKEAALLDFGWRSAFKEVSRDMARCITIAIEDFSTKILQQEQNERSSAVSYAMNLINVQQVWQDSCMFPEEEQPKKIAKRLFINRPIFLVPVQRYQEFINTLQFQVTEYCVRVCATSILQDAESHHWDDYKAFYEGERCSFSLQMWHYFYWTLHHDLWTILPPKLAQEILAEVLEKSLGLLASRYARAHPSYKRTPQIRLDITTILICTENMLWPICTSVQKLLYPHEYIDDKIFKIHSHCNNLFTTLVILTSPLTELYKTFQHGLDESASHSLKSFFNQPLHWVSCISHFYPSLLRTPSAGGLKAEGQLKLLLSQPSCNWNLLLETLLHHDGLLLRILLKSS